MRSATFSEPDPSVGVLGPSLAGKQPKTDQHFNLYFSFLLRPLVSVGLVGSLVRFVVRLTPMRTPGRPETKKPSRKARDEPATRPGGSFGTDREGPRSTQAPGPLIVICWLVRPGPSGRAPEAPKASTDGPGWASRSPLGPCSKSGRRK